jgi:hypothetical protein
MKEIKRAADLVPDRRNANKGTVRGRAAVGESLSRYGAGRSVLVDKNGKLIAGNTTTEEYVSNGNDNVIVVPTDGKTLVVVQRTDLDLDTDMAARELAHADNRSNQLGYDPDIKLIAEDIAEGADLGWLWRADDLEAMRSEFGEKEEDPDPQKDVKNIGFEIVVVLNSEEEMVEARKAIQDLGYYTK